MTVRGVRGATTVTKDEQGLVLKATEQLVQSMAQENGLAADDIISVLISTTVDVQSAFPAKAVRSIDGWTYVPVMCMHEMDVAGGMPLCIRVLMHANTELSQQEVTHIYLNDAVRLRPDLAGQ